MALAVGYSLSNWSALVRFADDGRIEAENNAAERALRSVAIGRKNFLHLGSDAGGNSAAVIYTLIGSALCRARHSAEPIKLITAAALLTGLSFCQSRSGRRT